MWSCDFTHTFVFQTLCHRLLCECVGILCECVGRYICVAEFYLESFHMIARTHVCYGRQDFVVAASVCGACVCFCLGVRHYMCSRSKPSSAVTTHCDGD